MTCDNAYERAKTNVEARLQIGWDNADRDRHRRWPGIHDGIRFKGRSNLFSLAIWLHVRRRGPDKSATILTDLSAELSVMDRYERRALSRREFAIRALDAARAQRFNPTFLKSALGHKRT